MSFGKNLKYLTELKRDLSEEGLAELLGVSCETVLLWESDGELPDMNSALKLCEIFGFSLDSLFRSELSIDTQAYSAPCFLILPTIRYLRHTVISTTPELDAMDRIYAAAKQLGIEDPKVIGRDYPFLSKEQLRDGMHGYEAALILPKDFPDDGLETHIQTAQSYAAVNIEQPFLDPASAIPNAYKLLYDYIRVNGAEPAAESSLPCFETDGMNTGVYIACKPKCFAR